MFRVMVTNKHFTNHLVSVWLAQACPNYSLVVLIIHTFDSLMWCCKNFNLCNRPQLLFYCSIAVVYFSFGLYLNFVLAVVVVLCC